MGADEGRKGTKRQGGGGSQSSGRRPSGRSEVVEAIIDSARALFGERSPSRVPLREIAERAGVNFGLVYQYVGSKENLVAQVLQKTAANAAERLSEAEDFDEALGQLMTFGDGTTVRMVAWSLLEGTEPSALFGPSPVLALLAGLARRDASRDGRSITEEEAGLVAALAMVMVMGWRLFGAAALAASGLDVTSMPLYDTLVARCVSLAGLAPSQTRL